MMNLIQFKLRNGKRMFFIDTEDDRAKLKAKAINLSMRVFADKEMWIHSNNRIISCEMIDETNTQFFGTSERMFFVGFLLNETVQFLKTDGVNVQGAACNIILRYGIEPRTSMLIYEIEQKDNREDAMKIAKENIKDKKFIISYINLAMKRFSSDSSVQYLEQDFKILISILRDAACNQFRDVDSRKLVVILACLIYITDTSKFTLGKIKLNTSNIQEPLDNLCRILHNDIERYKAWLTGAYGSDIVIV